MRRRLFNAGYKSYIAKRKPRNCSSRLRFAEKCSDWNFNDLKKVIFSDESYLKLLTEKNRSYVRYFPSESDKPFRFQPCVQGGGGSNGIWTAMTAKGIAPLVFYDDRMNERNYIDALKYELVPYIKKISMEVNHDTNV